LPGKGVELLVRIVGETAGLSKALDGAGGEVKDFGSSALGTAAKVSVVAGAALAAGAAIASMTDAAADDRAEQQKLELAIEKAGAATAKSTQQVEDAIAAGQARAFSDSETREGLQSLVTATGDVETATSLLAQAQDIARFANVDLATASEAVAKAYAGQDGKLQKLIPGLEKGATAAETIGNASAAAAGQADLFANSAEGMKAQAGDAFGELGEEIGSVFLPVLDAILPVVIQMIRLFGKLIKAVLPLLVPVLEKVGAALVLMGKALEKVINFVISLIEWITKAISKLGSFLDNLNPLKNFKMPSLPFMNSASTPAGNSVSTLQGGGSSGGGITFNIYGDPAVIEAKVTKALRDYTRRNGTGSLAAFGRL
jgi:hypothetical protein